MKPEQEVHKFNHDLLANADDMKRIDEFYPRLKRVLYHEELIRYFNQFNDRADEAKRKSRLWGKWAIVLGAVAIVLAEIEIGAALIKLPSPWALLIGAVASVCGLVSATVGVFGVLYGSRKREWLQNRFVGERTRQFHFQSLIVQLTDIATILEAATEDTVKAAETRFLSRRRTLFGKFQEELNGNADAKLNNAISSYGEGDWWLHNPSCRTRANDTEILNPVFDAYRELRIQHQLDYTNYKLQDDHKIFSGMPVKQARVLQHVTNAGIAWLLLIHAIVLGVVVFTFATVVAGTRLDTATTEATEVITIVFSVAIIAIAVVALAARAFEQGIQPEREIERYQQYRSALRSTLGQFEKAETTLDKIRIMRQMEQLAFEEMRNFLRTHERASFAI